VGGTRADSHVTLFHVVLTTSLLLNARVRAQLPPFLESIQSRKECKNLDLESYLIKPMQRLTKYPLLIQARLPHTRTQAECVSLTCAISALSRLC
jgi:hypothetical protein